MNSTIQLSTYDQLHEKIKTKNAKVSILGLGYVGLPTAYEKAKEGFGVFGLDVSLEKVNKVNLGMNYISDIDDEEFTKIVNNGMLKASNDFSYIAMSDVVVICVPTPIHHDKKPDLSFVKSAAEQIIKYAHKGMLVIFESTTYPGTTEDFFVKPLEEKGFVIGEDLFVAYSPERVDPGNKVYTVRTTPKVVGGKSSNCTHLASIFVGDNAVEVNSLESAEMAKVFENTFRFINIALVNETAMLCEKMGIDIWEVVNASATKPYGFMPFYPGPGVGGHCIPVDPYYLTYKANELGLETKMINTSGEINDSMSEYVVSKTKNILFENGINPKKANVLVLGAAYKKDISDLRESPALPIMSLLNNEEINFSVSDPYVESFHLDGKTVNTISITNDNIEDYDLVLVLTDHTNVDYDMVGTKSSIIFDTKNVFSSVKDMKAQYHKL
jgi:UDP-N-acetyl-D-glucosamine dehydrogenase